MTARIVRTESPDYARDLSSLQRTESFPIETEATDVLFHDGPFEEILRLSVYEPAFRSIHMALGLSIRWAARPVLSALPPLSSETYASI